MNSIEELLKTHCPNGVEYKPLGEVCCSLKKNTLKQELLQDNGQYPVINSGREFYGYYDKFNNDSNAFTLASRGEYAGFVTYINQCFWAGGLCYPYRSNDENLVMTKFIYYFLKSREQNIMDTLVARGSIPAINKQDIDKFQIPIPPLIVQEKIVTILDTFTELEAELEARKKQYAYYREKLLSFDYLDSITGGGH